MLELLRFAVEEAFSKNKEPFHVDIAKKLLNDRELKKTLKGIFIEEGLKVKKHRIKEIRTPDEGLYEGFSLSFTPEGNNINVNNASFDVCWHWWDKGKITIMSKLNDDVTGTTRENYSREDYINGGSETFRNDVKKVIESLRSSLEDKGTPEAIIP